MERKLAYRTVHSIVTDLEYWIVCDLLYHLWRWTKSLTIYDKKYFMKVTLVVVYVAQCSYHFKPTETETSDILDLHLHLQDDNSVWLLPILFL